jgi:hypothetical protein
MMETMKEGTRVFDRDERGLEPNDLVACPLEQPSES